MFVTFTYWRVKTRARLIGGLASLARLRRAIDCACGRTMYCVVLVVNLVSDLKCLNAGVGTFLWKIRKF